MKAHACSITFRCGSLAVKPANILNWNCRLTIVQCDMSAGPNCTVLLRAVTCIQVTNRTPTIHHSQLLIGVDSAVREMRRRISRLPAAHCTK
jgi:hypothetical protein